MEMIQDAKDGKIDYIITKSISRFARNTLDCLHYIRLLKGLDKPIGVYFEKEKLDTLDSKSEFFLTLLSSMAQEESRAISENTTWSVVRQFQRGNAFIPTNYFLVYDTDEDGKIVVDEEQAETVRYIFRLFLERHVDYIITKNVSRLSRNVKELIEMVNGLKEINVEIYFEKENVDMIRGLLKVFLSLVEVSAIGLYTIEEFLMLVLLKRKLR